MSRYREIEKYNNMFLTSDTLPEGNFDFTKISAYSGRRSRHAAKDVIHMWASIRLSKSNEGTRYRGRKVIRIYS